MINGATACPASRDLVVVGCAGKSVEAEADEVFAFVGAGGVLRDLISVVCKRRRVAASAFAQRFDAFRVF
jgi:hypothetical protein